MNMTGAQATGPDDIADISSVVENDDQSEASDEEEECRVCRGPAEEGRLLYAPCKCSGSIGLTHQDCLMSWLAVTRGDGRCELCHMKFKFAPKYKEGAPDHLSPLEVFLGLCSRATEKWMPLTLRFAAAIFMWLGMVPLTTTYLYHGWMHRPSSIISRLKWELVLGDLVSGAVITSFIIVTFLSFMSFADFLRFNWQNQGGLDGERARRNRREEEEDDEDDDPVVDLAVVEVGAIFQMQDAVARAKQGKNIAKELRLSRSIVEEMEMRMEPEFREVPRDEERKQELKRYFRARELLQEMEDAELKRASADNGNHGALPNQALDDSSQEGPSEMDSLREAFQDAANTPMGEFLRGLEEDDDDDDDDDEDYQPPNPDDFEHEVLPDMGFVAPVPPFQRRHERMDAMDPVDPFQAGMNPDDDIDMDINVAVDELLGLRGPLNILIRNVFWLLAFNTTYLGLFAFIPKNFGSSVYSIAFNRTALSGWADTLSSISPPGRDEQNIGELLSALNEQSDRLDTTLRLPDLATITFGYLCMALCVVLLEAGVFMYSKLARQAPQNGENTDNTENLREGQAREAVNVDLPLMDAGRRRMMAQNQFAFLDDMGDREMDQMGGLGEQLSVALECLKALVKVGFLLFLKMLLLPLVLGSWLDAATLSLFGSTSLERILYAGGDLFASALLHWVGGITFMLLVTVSVLQLREVVHPGLLAHVIRPQEPQPDLLGNLLHETLATHAKRMVLSFFIYAVLLTLHVWLPARLIVASGFDQFLPFARPQFAHILTPQLQVPLELLVFHLTMLALLEKYKNRIGEMQHYWLRFLCDVMGLTEYVLPRTVQKFVLVGSRPVFLKQPTAVIEGEASNSTPSCQDDAAEINAPEHESPSPAAQTMVIDPFWYELAVKNRDLDDFISKNVEVHGGPPLYEVGDQQHNGERILRDCPGLIGLPLPPTEEAKVFGLDLRPNMDHLLPTSVGSYRLSRRIAEDGSVVIEFWREVPGYPIPRPPEGWDDLGVGGAAIQGRWAWGKERKSRIENGTAQRSRFFGDGKSRMSSFSLIIRIFMVVILSWFVITLLACCALAGPLLTGRVVFKLLRVPVRFVHDPFAFAVGVGVCISGFAVLAGLPRHEDSIWIRFCDWASSFRSPPPTKLLVVVGTLVLWFLASPLMLGFLYDLILLKGPQYFSGKQEIVEFSSLAMSWATGTLLLNAWAFLCLCSVFTWDFWVIVGNAALEADNPQGRFDAERQLNEIERRLNEIVAADGSNKWQGGRGTIGRFVNTLTLALLRWEWDVIDHEVLLQNCALPVATHILIALTAPLLAFGVWLFALTLVNQEHANVALPFVGEIDNGVYRQLIFRMLTITTLFAQLAVSNQAAVKRWFRAAHKAARDGRYLEGEILMNYHVEREA